MENKLSLSNIVSPLVKKEPSIIFDEHWYRRFRDLGFPFLKLCSLSRESVGEQKALFLEGKTNNPEFKYPELGNVDLDRLEQGLLTLKGDILKLETNEIIRQAYRWRINERIAKVRMLKACKDQDDQRFCRYSIFVYGKPSEQIHSYSVARLQHKIKKGLDSKDQKVRQAALRIQKEVADYDPSIMEDDISPSILNLPAKVDVDIEETLSPEEIKRQFELVLGELNAHGWKVVIDQTGRVRNFTVSQISQSVLIPGKEELAIRKKAITKLIVRSLIAHEMTHVRRRLTGDRSNLKLLGIGLDRYLKGDEGIATYFEQKILGANDFAGFLGHFAISLALGIDGRKRDFRQVFEILFDYELISIRDSSNEALDKAKSLAWKRALRIFRGTTGQSVGAVLTKDIVYREGNIAIWQLLKDNPAEERRFMIGKYDPTNPRHIWILDQLGISESDLEGLEEIVR